MKTPSLDVALAMGLRDLQLVCRQCRAYAILPLSSIDLPGDTPLDRIATLRPIACAKCSGACEVDLQAMGFREK